MLEAIACVAELRGLDGQGIERDHTLVAQRALADDLRLIWAERTRRAFFLVADDYFGTCGGSRNDARLDPEQFVALRGNLGIPPLPPLPPPDLRATAHVDELWAADFIAKRDARSLARRELDGAFREAHAARRPFLLDEPEAPLSPRRQLAFLEHSSPPPPRARR